LMVCVPLVPLMVVGAAVAAVSLAQFFVANLAPFGSMGEVGEPATWLDWAFGGGRGAPLRFVTFMAGGLTAAGSWAGIVWAFTGRSACR
jgi:hypothetical protein